MNGQVIKGMTTDEVKASWGIPNEIIQGTGGQFYYEYVITGGRGGPYTKAIVVFNKMGRVIISDPPDFRKGD